MTREQLAQFLAADEKPSQMDLLDNHEVELISLLSQGFNGTNICRELQITPEELASLKSSVRTRLNLQNDMELLQFAAKQRAQ
jgi:DNA-binding NarL/FixJ family response regulator